MKFSIRHATLYSFEQPRRLAVQALRLTPGSSSRQRVLTWNLSLPAKAMERQDAYGNLTHLLSLERPHQQLLLEAEGLIETCEGSAASSEHLSPLVFLRPSDWTRMDEPLLQFIESLRGRIEARPAQGLDLLAERLQQTLVLNAELPATTAVAAYRAGQLNRISLVHVFLACCRYLKIPARFVNGYRYWPQQSASHDCWAEVWDGQSWVGYDPVAGRLADIGYLKLAMGLDHLDACAVRFAQPGQISIAEQLEIQLLSR